MPTPSNTLQIGWAEADITPEKPVQIAGQFHARISEEVLDPLKAIVLVLESSGEQFINICCDLVSVSDELRDEVRQKICQEVAEIDTQKLIFNATHTHTAPEVRAKSSMGGHTGAFGNGIMLDAMPVEEYISFAADKIAEAIASAWNSKAPGGISYGSGFAVLGRCRRWVNENGVARMYGLSEENRDTFRHVEGYEDHSVNLLATYDSANNLTGIIFNAPMTAQETGGLFAISADIWCEARAELRKRFGENLHVLTQVSAAGELTPKLIYEKATNDRMLALKGRSGREEMAQRIAHSVEDILPYLSATIDTAPTLKHEVAIIDLPLNSLTEKDVQNALEEAAEFESKYDQELAKLEANPELKKEKRWYVPLTLAFRKVQWNKNVERRFHEQDSAGKHHTEVHVVRLGEIVFASNPFEYYVDFGVQVKVRSPFLQTFLIQLAGPGTYVPSPRSVTGGGYGSVPASNPIGPEGGQILADKTVELIRSLWE